MRPNRSQRISLSLRGLAASLAALLIIAGASAIVYGQVLYGSLVGNVKDNTGAAVSGATVKITNKVTNQTREVTTNAEGSFNIPTVQTGLWELTVSKSGFKTLTRSNIEIVLNSITRSDVTLDVGEVSETVSVTADAALLQTDRSEVRAELTSQKLLNLPIPPGRNYQQLFRTLPGITPPTNAHSVPTNPSRALQYNVNGTNSSSNNVRIDGASQYNLFLPHVTAYVPSLESIETVNVVTNNFDAEQGLAGGAAVNVQIKSGTNNLHGSLFEYHDNHLTKARPWQLTPINGVPQDKPKRVYNQFGGTLGGPIVKDRLFYFFSYEGTNDRQLGARFLTLPTAEMRAGDLTGGGVNIYDPETGNNLGQNRVAFPGAVIPTNRIDPIAARILQSVPLPNRDGFANNYYATAPYSYDKKTIDSKVNWNITDKLTTYGRFSFLTYKQLNPGALGDADGVGTAPQGGNTGTADGNTYGVTVAGVYTLNSNFVIDANVGYTKQGTSSRQGFLDQQIGLDVLGIPGTNGTRDFENGWPRFRINGYANIGVQDAFMPYTRNDPQWVYVTNFNWTKGNHNIRFGFDFARQTLNHLQAEWNGGGNAEPGSGGFIHAAGPTQLCRTANAAGTSCSSFEPGNNFNSFATFLLGYHTNAGRTLLVEPPIIFKARAYSFYIRDAWQVRPNLTFTFGTRYERYPMPRREDRGIERYDFNTNTMQVCGVGGVPDDCGVKLSNKLFAPRLGIAWRVNDSFVVRTGYGLTYDPISLARTFRTNYPMLLAFNIVPANSALPAGKLADGIPPSPAPDISSGSVPVPGNVNVLTLGDSFKRPYIQSWNLVLERNLGWGFTGSVGYIATRTVAQSGQINVNAGRVGGGTASQPLNQRFGRVASTNLQNGLFNSHYDSMQANLKKRFSNGLQLDVAYTWSKAIGMAGLGFDNDGALPINDPNFIHLNRGLLSIDLPHNFQFNGAWELPFGRGQRWGTDNRFISALTGGWQLSWLFGAFAGTPFTVSASGTSLNAPGNSQRADLVKSKVEKLGGFGTGTPFYDPTAFMPVEFGPGDDARFGTSAFNFLRSPGTVNLDLGLFRQFSITESIKLQFRVEAFNATNTPHLGVPGGNASAPSRDANGNILLNANGLPRLNGFMEITGTRQYGREGIDERLFRFGLRLSF
ncbi:MAG: TonB-dependent receptor [Acidobacteriota bacterium]|nr:MAG: TonB-dependent receptor [Acidobacteriota bacterium]